MGLVPLFRDGRESPRHAKRIARAGVCAATVSSAVFPMMADSAFADTSTPLSSNNVRFGAVEILSIHSRTCDAVKVAGKPSISCTEVSLLCRRAFCAAIACASRITASGFFCRPIQ